MDVSYTDAYLYYIQKAGISVSTEIVNHINECLQNADLNEPKSSTDWNNVAVLILIEAEQCDEKEVRSLYLSNAFEALNNGVRIDNHPLCIAHVALIHSLIGETNEAINLAFSTFVNILQSAYDDDAIICSGLVYLPCAQNRIEKQSANLKTIILADNGYQQALSMLGEVLYCSQLVFYNSVGLRLLNLNAHLVPESSYINLKLGISNLMCNQTEGLLYLHKAEKLSPNAAIVQALYLAYRDLGLQGTANFWLTNAKKIHQKNTEAREWQWANLLVDNQFTYISFENSLTMAVEPSFRSIVTGVLIAEGDWFEKEIEFWRSWLKPGMTVIDVGANVGVYTFSAALQVGSQGKVIAVEPFSGCVNCLQETKDINQLSWVKICQGAASDRLGTVRLSLHAASELNEIVDDSAAENMQPGTFEEVRCFTLDSLIAQENLSQVDFLKIDAEGHELQVLLGSDRILSEFAPIILYENIAASQGSNIPVANYLIDRNYKLFRYKPYVQELIPLDSTEELHGNLNIIALPQSKYES